MRVTCEGETPSTLARAEFATSSRSAAFRTALVRTAALEGPSAAAGFAFMAPLPVFSIGRILFLFAICKRTFCEKDKPV